MSTKAHITPSAQDYEKEFQTFLNEEKHLGLLMRRRVEKFGDKKIAVRHKPHGEWISYTWGQFGAMIDDTGKGLLSLGAKEREMIGIFSGNSVWWAAADFACYMIRACSIPIYATNSARELEYIVNDAGIRFLFVGNADQLSKALEIGRNSKTLEKIIVMDDAIVFEKTGLIMGLAELMETGRKSGVEQEFQHRVNSLDSDDLSTLIYTSGTTGEPKGVILTHRNWLAMGFGTGYHIKPNEKDVNLAFLPLSHVFERAWSYFILYNNGRVDYCHDTKAIMEFLKETQPHYMCSVPRMWEKVHAMVLEQMNNAPEKKRKIFNWALEVGGRYQYRKKDHKFIGPGLRLKHAVAHALVLKKIRNLFGGRTKVYNVGGSAFSGEIAEFFFKIGVLLLQGYGMTECFVICVSNPERNRFGTCGPVVPLMNVRISPEGEIQAKGPSMMQGYWNKPELTKQTFTEDGWIKTGDQGYIDEDGYIVITDRIKDMMKTSGGKYISPQQIETLLKEDLYIEQAAAIGDGRKYVSALVVPSFEPLRAYAKRKGIAFTSDEDLVRNKDIIAFYREKIDRLTKDLGQVEQIKRFTLLPEEFTQERGEITATQKIRRKVVGERYRDIIESMYRE